MKLYLVLAATAALFACNSNTKTGEKKNDTASSTPATSPSGKIDIESFGDIRIGQHHKQVLAVLGKPDMQAPPIEWEADGLMHEDWAYGSKGLNVNLSSEIGKEDSTRSIFTIVATYPCTFKTKANMGIGNTYEEVKAAYKRDINAEMTNEEQIVVGQIYGGIIFSFGTDKKVNRVFLGAAAE